MSPKPQLPEQFVEDLLAKPTFSDIKSCVYSDNFHNQRFKMVTGTKPTQIDLSADHTVCIEGDSLGMGPGSKRTWLHLGAVAADPLLVCEMIRIGATIDIPDTRGATALWLAADSFAKATAATKRRQTLGSRHPPSRDPGQRLTFVLRTLIEQHANVNIIHEGVTPLHLSCQARAWEIISLLLEHGANPSPASTPPAIQLFTNSADKKRFKTIAKEFSGKPRPARPCPCWSGKLLSECHDSGEEKPYPPEFICKCGSGKTYKKCCSRRNAMSLCEVWDAADNWIMSATKKTLPVEGGEAMVKLKQITADARARGVALPGESVHSQFQASTADTMAANGVMDVAYAFAMKQVNFNPRPAGKSASKRHCLELQREWNEAVDKYIALNIDPRPRDDIERAAKIGSSCGALYKLCEGPGCGKMEGREVPKLNYCSKCTVSVYCCRDCQAKAWRSHKAICDTPTQVEQALPSQVAMADIIAAQFASLTSSS